MGGQTTLSIYLAGASKCLEDEGRGWKESAEKILAEVSKNTGVCLDVTNPIKYFSYSEPKYKTQKQVKQFYMYKIKQCDLLLVNLDDTDKSVGTGQEVQAAVMLGKPVIGFGKKNVYPWISEVDCDVVFDTVFEAANYISEYFCA